MISKPGFMLSIVVSFLLFAIVPVVKAQMPNPQELLNQYISDLQKNPNDNTLREKIIMHVQEMGQKPTVPEEAKKYVNRGVAAAEGAKTENDYKDAIAEFQKAVNIAPWVGAGYRGLAVMQDKAGQYSQALQNLKLFLLTNPLAADTEAAKALMDKIEYRQEKAAKEVSPEMIAEKEKNKYKDWLKKLDGARFVNINRIVATDDITYWESTYVLEIHGNEIVYSSVLTSTNAPDRGRGEIGVWHEKWREPLLGRKFTHEIGSTKQKFTISEEGNTITEDYINQFGIQSYIYRRKY